MSGTQALKELMQMAPVEHRMPFDPRRGDVDAAAAPDVLAAALGVPLAELAQRP